MEQWPKDELDIQERSGYLRMYRALTRAFTAPFWWYNPDADLGTAIKHNGTICFVNTGAEVIGVTAWHVYEQYLEDRENDNNTICQIGSSTFDPKRHVIDFDEDKDLATFSIPEFLIAAANGNVHQPIEWPPKQLQESEIVILGGYPRILREEKHENAEFPFVSFISRINQSSESHTSYYLNIEGSYWPQGESLNPEPDLAGLSGGPVYRVHTEDIERLELAGFIYQAQQTWELVRARHASDISVDGKVKKC